ncbi:integration host factor (plasmid) [Kitasatospora sp. NBC_00070]
MAVRRERGELKVGIVTLEQVLEREDVVVAKTPVRRLLEALPGVGKARADKLMSDVGISDSHRVTGLGARQRERLMEPVPSQG